MKTILAFIAGGVLVLGLVQTQTGRILIGGSQAGWVTLTVEDATVDTTYTFRGTGHTDEVVATERRVAEMIAAAMPSPTPTVSPTPTPTPTPTLQCVRFNPKGKCIKWA